MKLRTFKTSARSAFTLLELLIVVALIAVLMTMSVVVMASFMTQAEEEATAATILKLSRLIEQRTEAINRAFTGVQVDIAEAATRALLVDPNGDGNRGDGIFGVSSRSVNILARKAFYRTQLPQHFEELLRFQSTPSLVAGMPNLLYFSVAAPRMRAELGLPDTTPLNDPGIVSAVTAKFAKHALNGPETESSEMLYFALVASGNFGASVTAADRFTNAEVQDTDEDGLPEFVDSWGKPLRFYRWPTRLVDWNAPNPFQPDLSDTDDPTDVDVTIDTDSDGIPDTAIGQRRVLADDRAVANLLMKGLPPAPSLLPNGVLPRDLLLTDPDDPVGFLYSELEKLNGAGGTAVLATFYNETNFHTPDTFHTPVVISGGPDEQLGLFEPHDVANNGHLAAYDTDLDGNGTAGESSDFAALLDLISDNLTSRNKRAGGRR
jgi:prepilin-type N-terminal cleavage/methylation domain-containing protein